MEFESSNKLRTAAQRLFDRSVVDDVLKLLVNECGENLPLVANNFERVQFAALKLSDGDITRLKLLVNDAKNDWRDLLVAAGFHRAVDEHMRWFENLCQA
ncbi:MAG: hypothetical protein JO269_11345 [Burkholderiaceae bacterium]|nr:hypothetical protein [Burkholderiaceae bacterium]